MRLSSLVFGGVGALLVSPATLAGIPAGSSTLTINWTSGATAVPTLGLYGTIALALLVMVAMLRILRDKPAMLRAIAPLAGLGITLGAGVWVQDLTAGGIVAVPDVGATSCNGSQTYTADAPTPPPCFVNTCGAPVTVSYTFVSATDPTGSPLTAEGCTFEYYCEDAVDGDRALNGAQIPSDGRSYATAYCREIFPLEVR